MEPGDRAVVLAVLHGQYAFLCPNDIATFEIRARLTRFASLSGRSSHLASRSKHCGILKRLKQWSKKILIDNGVVIDQDHNVTRRFLNSQTSGCAKIKTRLRLEESDLGKTLLK